MRSQQYREEVETVVLASVGDQDAFCDLVETFRRPVYSICYRLLGDPMAAEDASQEVFLRAYLKRHTFDQSRKYSNWLFSIATHYCLDRLKKRRVPSISWEDLPAEYQYAPNDQATPEDVLIKAETGEQIRTLVYALPPRYRKPVLFKYWRGLSYCEIAHLLNMTVSSVKSRLFRGRKMVSNGLVQ